MASDYEQQDDDCINKSIQSQPGAWHCAVITHKWSHHSSEVSLLPANVLPKHSQISHLRCQKHEKENLTEKNMWLNLVQGEKIAFIPMAILLTTGILRSVEIFWPGILTVIKWLMSSVSADIHWLLALFASFRGLVYFSASCNLTAAMTYSMQITPRPNTSIQCAQKYYTKRTAKDKKYQN